MPHLIRKFAPTAVASLGLIVFAGAFAPPARANNQDFGPLKDVIAVRSAFGTQDPDLGSVRVCGDWADVFIYSKGVSERVVRRSQGWRFDYDPKKAAAVAGAFDLKAAPASVRDCFAHVVIPK